MPDEFPPPPPPEEVPPPPPEDTRPDAASAEPQPKRCIKPMSSLLLGFLGCLIGGLAVYGVFYDSGDAKNVQITGNLGQMENVLVEDTTTRSIKQFIAGFGQWFGAVGALLGLFGLIAAVTHFLQASARQVIPQRWLASFGAVVSLVACCSVGAMIIHGYQANVGLPVENTKEVFNRLDQVAKIQQKAQDIAEGNVPLQPGDQRNYRDK